MNRYIYALLFIFLPLNFVFSTNNLFGYQIKTIPNNLINTFPLNGGISLIHFGILYQNYYFPIPLNGNNYLNIYFNSSNPVQIYILNQSNYYNFENGLNYIPYYENYTNFLNTSIYIPEGQYYLIILNTNYNSVYFYLIYNLAINSINELYYPIGISDYGIFYNYNINQIQGYKYETNLVVGSIYLQDFNVTVEPICSINSFYNNAGSIQLNAVLEVNTINGLQYYWLQNVLLINNTGGYYYIEDNIWNWTSIYANISNNSIIGSGDVYLVNLFSQYYYAAVSNIYNLSYPLNIYLIINVSQNNSYPEIQFGYSFDGENIVWYDNVTLLIQSTDNYIIVEPNITPSGTPEDLELVIGGPGDGDCIYTNNINGYLGLYFLYNYNGQYYLSPILYSANFGESTAEASANINSYIYSQGIVQLSTGIGYPAIFFNNPENYFNLTIYYNFNNTNITYSLFPLQTIQLNFSRIINYNNQEYLLNGIYINGEFYNITNITLIANQNYNIYLDYVPIYNVTIFYYGLNKEENLLEVSGNTLYLNLSNYIYINDSFRYYLEKIIINGIEFNQNNIYLNITNNYFIYLYYIPQYKIEINFPYNYSINNTQYEENNYFWINNNSYININIDNYYYFSSYRYYCPKNNIIIFVNSSENIDLLNYCIIQYQVNISSEFPINISINGEKINNINNFNEYLNNSDEIVIYPEKLTRNNILYKEIYYFDGENITISSPENIYIKFNKKIEYNYPIIGGITSIPIAIILIYILY
jgi:hypothetical protein